MTNYYDYEELRAKALNGKQEDIDALGEDEYELTGYARGVIL